MECLPSLPAALGDQPAVVGQIETFLKEAISELEPPPPEKRGPGAPRVLPGLCLWAGMLVCIVRGVSSQLAIWRLLSTHGLWTYPRFPISDEAVYDRLERGGTAPLEALFVQVTTILRRRLAPYADSTLAPFAAEVVALDETLLDRLLRLLPPLQRTKGSAALPGRLATVFDLRRQQWIRAQVIEDTTERETLHARDLIAGLPAGSLILADLGYFAFAWFDDLTTAGYYWVSRMRRKVTYEELYTLVRTEEVWDAVVWLGARRADRARHAVRLVQVRVGQTTHTYLTNVLTPHELPVREIVRLYGRRWDVELAFKVLKRHLRLHLLWSTKQVVLAQQIWATLTIAQVLLALWMEIAARAEVEVFDVSVALLVSEAPLLAAAGRDPLEVFVTEGRRAGYIRPSRRIRRTVPEVPLEAYRPLPPELVLIRTPRYDTGQGSIPITPAAEVIHHPPPWTPAPPERRNRGGGSSRKICHDT